MDSINIERELDRVKAAVFLGTNAAFFGSLMCTLEFVWDESTKTAATDGVHLFFNPDFFLSITPDQRKFVLVHELWHVARLHMLRLDSRDPKLWNQACDLRINKDLVDEGFCFGDLKPWYDPDIGELSEEEIYEQLKTGDIKPPESPSWLGGDEDDSDIQPAPTANPEQIINNVAQAVQQAEMSGVGSFPENIRSVLDKFLAPIVPWENALRSFLTDLSPAGYSWKRPSRRYPDMYMPGTDMEETRLDHLIFYMDVSGSVSDEQVIRFNSEVKHVKETYNPHLLTLVQFDTRITWEKTFDEFDELEEIEVIGRGGTWLEPVRQHIEKHQPTAAIIFSDLECERMPEPKGQTSIVWIISENPQMTPHYGMSIHI